MAKQKEKIYKRRRPFRAAAKGLGIALLITIILLTVVFFWFPRYIVHTPDGIRLDVPFLRGILDEIPEIIEEPTVPPPDTSRPDPIEPDAPPFSAYVTTGEGALSTINWVERLESMDATAIVITTTEQDGTLLWNSGASLATRFALHGEMDFIPTLGRVSSGTSVGAVISAFYSPLLAARNAPIALNGGFLDPESAEVRTFIQEISVELAEMGFSEIILANIILPPEYSAPTSDAMTLALFTSLSAELSRRGVALSVMVDETAWIVSEDETSLLRMISRNITRFYTELSPETLADNAAWNTLNAAVAEILGEESARFIPVGPAEYRRAGNWAIR